MAGEEVIQLYVTDVKASVPVPVRSLQGIKRIFLSPGEKKTVTFTLVPRQLSLIDDDNKTILEPGLFKLAVGGKQPDLAGARTTAVLTGQFEVTGDIYYIE